jgi:hypothetical protein
MKKFLMIASAAAMAVSMPALAKPDKGNGGGGNHAAQGGGGGNKHANKGGGGADFKPQKIKGNDGFKQAEKAQKQQFKAAERSVKSQNKASERFAKAQDKQAERVAKQQNKAAERVAKSQERALGRQFRNDDVQRVQFGRNSQGFCPPGLDKKNNGCMAPGQAKKVDVGQRFQSDWFRNTSLPSNYRNLFSDNDEYFYRFDENGYIYRVDRDTNMVAGLIPLLGGGFQVGQVLPAGFDAYNVPLQYRDQYFDNSDLMYRFGDNAIYQVDPQTRMIESVVALLTGQNFNVGQQMPTGFDMYNVPLQYRDQYYDTDQANYRYADGNIYQIDPTTQIVQAVIQALI